MKVPTRYRTSMASISGPVRWALAVVTCAAATAGASPPLFTGLGFIPGGTESSALGVTPNGAVVVGYSSTPFGDRAFRWTRLTGMVSLGTLPGDTDSRGVAVNADGGVIVGYSRSTGGYHAFRWTSGGGMKDMGSLIEGGSMVVNALSADGKVAVGYGDTPDGPSSTARHAFRWTVSGGFEDLGVFPDGDVSVAQGVSGDGSVVVGAAETEFSLHAFRYTDEQGMVDLGLTPGTFHSFSTGVSADGGVVVGFGRRPGGFRPFRWTSAGGMQDLGAIPDGKETAALATSADGSVVVGSSVSQLVDAAFLWTARGGLVSLNTYLIARGVDLTGWVLTSANAVSADGLTIVGEGNHNGLKEAWVAFLGTGQDLSPIEQLGKSLMFDSNLSSPAGQSCISCHAPSAGFTSPFSNNNAHGAVQHGAISSNFGKRKPPSAAYAALSPVLSLVDGTWTGGVFFDGHAPGWTLGDPLAEQAMLPLVSALEQNNASPGVVVEKVAGANYAALFRDVWGADSLPDDGSADVQLTYERIARSIAAYERSREVNPFNSKYDDYLAGRVELTVTERRGLELFEGIAMCSACHPSRPGPNGEPPLFTDFTYDNIGIPKNPENPFYTMPAQFNPDGTAFVDAGLGGFLAQAGYPKSVFGPVIGKHKVSTLRNVDRRPDGSFVRAYGHNGYFKTLEDVVHFYSSRDVEAWPQPEVLQNLNISELGDLHLTAEDEAAIVVFLKTLTDREVPPVLCPADFNRDGFVDPMDFTGFINAYELGNFSADFNRDGFVTPADYDMFLLAIEGGC